VNLAVFMKGEILCEGETLEGVPSNLKAIFQENW